MESKSRELIAHNEYLSRRNAELEAELIRVSKDHKREALLADAQAKAHKAKDELKAATSAVHIAEIELNKRKESIKVVMKTVAEYEETLKSTNKTIEALGFDSISPEQLARSAVVFILLLAHSYRRDPTARRLRDLRDKQTRAHAEAKATLLREYASMVAEAEALNETREELERKQFMADKQKQQAEALYQHTGTAGIPKSGSRDFLALPGAGLLERPRARSVSPQPGGPPIAVAAKVDKGPDKQDEGCLIM